MKQLIRRISRVADSCQYSLLRSNSSKPAASNRSRRSESSSWRRGKGVPVCVGEEMERFVVSAELLNHPVFIELLNKSAQEYGYEQKGVLRIPCRVLVFERVMESLRLGHDLPDVDDLLHSLFPSENDDYF